MAGIWQRSQSGNDNNNFLPASSTSSKGSCCCCSLVKISLWNFPKVDCSRERIRVWRKNLRILKEYSSFTLIKTRGTHYCCPDIWGASWSFTSLYQCIGRKYFQNHQIFATNPKSFSRTIYFSPI
jgi:hypothetical protein